MKKIIVYLLVLLPPTLNNANVMKVSIGCESTCDTYSLLKLDEIGLSSHIYKLAMKGFEKLKASGTLTNTNILTIVDYSQSSNKKRMYVINLRDQTLDYHTYVAHGKNTGEEYAERFSNEPGSLKSSLGFYITQHATKGSHPGLSLIINGLEKGFNDNAIQRAIIIHAANYATESYIKLNGRLGRSWGCPALSPELNDAIIEKIKDGTCLFIYNPNQEYISSSSFIN